MTSTKIYDADLNPVLGKATNEQLEILVDILKTKLSETLSITDAYKRYYPNHQKYADLIAKEFRDFGGNSIANVFRAEGPPYREIVCDVAKAIKAPFNRESDVDHIESAILATILSKAFEKMSDEEREALLKQVGRSNRSALAGGSAAAFLAVFKAGGFASYKLMLIVVNAVVKGAIGRGLPLVANAALARAMGIATGPVGWALTTLITLIQIAGPSYKITIPGVAYVAMLRMMQTTQDRLACAKCGAPVDGDFRFCPECGHEIEGNS